MKSPPISFFLFLLLLTSASAGNITGEWKSLGCVAGETTGECLDAAAEGEEYDGAASSAAAVVRRILQQQNKISYTTLQRQPVCNANVYGNCISSVNRPSPPCTYYNRCKR
ncbi:PREDICTED: protein RALF-like 27 [Tarenaya hassleriana]|uniref:protein RALF-like 27 n=1 Tax=Tarenaya hassleriana TaxID=28532 RepID=UPI00053C785B|nr:PREDICTED: protein RALF-like 27 [Tarenaya hassleriana]